MMDNALKVISSEFKRYGVKFELDTTGSNHYKMTWQATPDKEVRHLFVAKTPSDGRGTMNCRAQLRRMFKQDNIPDPREVIAKRKPTLHKALAIPVVPTESELDQITMMRAELADLSDLVLELSGLVEQSTKLLAAISTPNPVPVLPAMPPAIMPPPILAPPTSGRGINTLEYLSDNFNSLDALARDMGVSVIVAKRKLNYLLKKELVEVSFGKWRKKPVDKKAAARAEAAAAVAKLPAPRAAKHAKASVTGTAGWEYINVLEYLTDKWQSTGALAEAMGLPTKQAYNRLYNRKTLKGGIEFSDGCWRIEPAAATATARANNSRNIKTIDYVTDTWTSTADLARKMGVSNGQAYNKLYYLLERGLLDTQGKDSWRLKPKKMSNGTKANSAPANGHARH